MDTPSLDNLLDQLEDIGGLEMIGPEGLTLLLALWRKSMKLAWARTFVMTNTEAIYKSGLKNRETLNKYRNKLVQCGFIHYKAPARGRSDGTYTLEFDLKAVQKKKVVSEAVKNPDNFADNSEVVKEVVKNPDNFADRFADNFADNFAYNSADNFADNPPVSSNECKIASKKVSKLEGKIDARARTQDAWETLQHDFEEIFHTTMNSSHFEMVASYLNDGMEIELILLALEDARSNKAKYSKYLWTILNNWITKGIKTVDDYRKYMQTQAGLYGQESSAQQQGRRRNARDTSDLATPARKSNVVSITGGQVGWIRPAGPEGNEEL